MFTYDGAAALEWIETNGLGGWASSTVCFANTRRYHGLLVAATETERRVLVAKLDESIDGVSLATNRFPDAIHPRGKVTGAGRTWDEARPSDAGELGAPSAGISDRNGPSDPDAKRNR